MQPLGTKVALGSTENLARKLQGGAEGHRKVVANSN